MTMNLDEQALATALHDLAADQPDAPVDRMQRIRGRHRRRRMMQAVSSAIAVALIATAGLATSRVIGGSSADRDGRQVAGRVSSWQLDWPTRGDGSVDTDAVLSWLATDGFHDIRDVHWLYAGMLPATTVRWALLEAHYSAGAGDNGVDGMLSLESTADANKWVVTLRSAPSVAARVIAFGDWRRGTIWALAAPGATSVVLGSPRAANAVDTVSFPPLRNGVSVMTRTGPLRNYTLFVQAARDASSSLVALGNDAPGNDPAWAHWEPALRLGDAPVGTSSGGAGGGWKTHVDATGTLTLDVRCIGEAPWTIHVRATLRQDITVDRCDGLFHEYVAGAVRKDQFVDVTDTAATDDIYVVEQAFIRP